MAPFLVKVRHFLANCHWLEAHYRWRDRLSRTFLTTEERKRVSSKRNNEEAIQLIAIEYLYKIPDAASELQIHHCIIQQQSMRTFNINSSWRREKDLGGEREDMSICEGFDNLFEVVILEGFGEDLLHITFTTFKLFPRSQLIRDTYIPTFNVERSK